MTSLAALLGEHARQIEADLRRYYQVDLRDLWRPRGGASRLTYRLLGVLFDGLPGESLTKTAIRDAIPDETLAEMARRPRDRHGVWSHTDLRLANIEDLLKWVIYAVYHSRGLKPEQPEPTPRPGIAAKGARRRIGAAQMAHLRRLREEHAQLHGYDAEAG